MWWTTVTGIAVALVLGWLALLVTLWRTRPESRVLSESLRLLPDLLRLIGRLAKDSTLPRGVRIRLVALLAYLASPLDLVPDVIPVIGYADDVIIIVVVLRSTIKRAGVEAITRHWPGTPDGLAAVLRLCAPRGSAAGQERRPDNV